MCVCLTASPPLHSSVIGCRIREGFLLKDVLIKGNWTAQTWECTLALILVREECWPGMLTYKVVSLVGADTTLEMVLYYPWQPSVTIYYTIMAVSASHDCHVTVNEVT